MGVDPKWLAVDWSKPGPEIARELNVSRQRVHQMRRKLNAPDPHTAADSLRALGPNFTAEQAADTLGLSPGRVRAIARQNNIPLAPMPRGTPSKYAWGEVDWEGRTNAEIVKDLGMNGSFAASCVRVSRERRARAPHTIGRFVGTPGHRPKKGEGMKDKTRRIITSDPIIILACVIGIIIIARILQA